MAPVTLSWLQVINLLGAIQGLVLAGALVSKRSNRTANRLLAATMVAFSIYLATDVYHAAGFVETYPHFFGAAHPMPFLFGPLIYLYAVTVSDRTRQLTPRDALHFVPFLAVVLNGLPVYLMSGADKLAFYHRIARGDVPPSIAMALPLKLLSGVIYATITLLFLRRHHELVRASYSSVERVNLRWLLWLCGGAAAIWTIAVLSNLLESVGLERAGFGDDVIALAMAVMVYGIGYMGLRQPEIFRYDTAEYRVPVELRVPREPTVPGPVPSPPQLVTALPATDESQVSAPDAPSPRYERSGLSDREAQRLKEHLVAVMDSERPWRDSDLTLADLADRLETTPHKLSEVLNSQLGLTFYDFVNGYRVREVQRRIAAGDARRVTMLALALDAGFASKSTFNVVFKKHTQQTPSDYRQAAGA
ncbi:MAG TPA: helix-turn-helix domain-containing protein [Gemmatimonadaceae bacterium]|jgi:AraC-like DNA-binding protein|nr:helix-turn-helix domain-containing protein [Gemmatimonadaceae bacterium]